MGKGKNGCSGSMAGALDSALAEQELQFQGEVKRHPSRGKAASPERAARRRAKMQKRIQELDAQIQYAADHPEEIEAWIRQMSDGELWRYSYGNILLARLDAQRHGIDMTRVASKTRWRELGYEVDETEARKRPLRILRPEVFQPKDENGDPKLDRNGKPLMVRSFKPAWIYDISQTRPILDDQGQPVNSDLQARPEAEQALRELETVAREQGILVYRGGVHDADQTHRERLNAALASQPSAGGFFTEIDQQRIIVTRPGLGPRDEARVLAHELAHAMMHAGQAGYRNHDDRVRKEAEAESAAYVLMSHYGLQSQEQAFYVAHWVRSLDERLRKEGLDEETTRQQKSAVVKEALGNIQATVKTVLARAEELREAA